jgi:hypothetical protein
LGAAVLRARSASRASSVNGDIHDGAGRDANGKWRTFGDEPKFGVLQHRRRNDFHKCDGLAQRPEIREQHLSKGREQCCDLSLSQIAS